MKRFLFAVFFLCGLIPVHAVCPDSVHLVILHTNDTHSRIDPIETTAARNAGRGGALRREALIAQIRKEAEKTGAEVLLLDAGDFVQGTPYFNFYHGKVEVEMMNRMGYDAVTLGNHEFDRGIPALAKMLSKADFPVVCSNYDFSATAMSERTLPYLKIKKGDLMVGIVSAGVKLDNLVTPRHREGLQYLDALQQAETYARRLKQEGCDLVVCLSHLGYSSVNAFCDIELAESSSSIDVIIGGHSHTYLKAPRQYTNQTGLPVLVSQMGKDGIYLGRMDLMIKVK